MRASRVTLGVAAVLVVAASACSSSPKATGTPAPGATPSAASTAKAKVTPPPLNQRINVADFSFSPRLLTIRAGTTVIWYQEGPASHTVTSGSDNTATGATSADKKFSSGTLKAGSNFSFTFTTPGVYNYFCSLHPKQMSALIVVE